MTRHLAPFDLWKWVEENKEAFRPPVGNKELWKDSEFIVMMIHGPNARRDFHVDPSDEIFYQLRGDTTVRIINEEGTREPIAVREGEIFRLPAYVPHTPIRPAGSWGLVVKRRRKPGQQEELVWYCDRCDNELHRVRLQLTNIELEIAEAIHRFNTTEDLRGCTACGHVIPEEVEAPA